ncbi:putative serine/threonine-protein kinase VPS15 [Neolecta irregularis DAH-3]|uniref:non-specific serine/threonine protein kinase n=1 Tax=Neolecta irregularis (strain DAH-3) TaxID=1198029 RepID=A0A1U7LRX3_NEOID|nr:putative serine/threonine-protein kinase VPS15 [Neolecta irregularis DAH-3]|eukprot:OLL25379.1 putative serine/threonine-protein kinase VPS15 [Neolecta irregularis DAH-3]
MGASLSSLNSAATTATIDSYVAEIGDMHYERRSRSARFIKTIRAKHKDGPVVIKIFIKPQQVYSLADIIGGIERENNVLVQVFNAFPPSRILETDKAIYAVRQHFYSSLYDRISTRPFLETIEKKWITFQLLCGLRDCHEKNVRHGDLKTENVLVTSWNWIYIVDFAFFKPTFLPEDNPADFSFFFDTSLRRACYIAPERFLATGDRRDGELTDAMDIFSLGCVIAELYLEGTPLFTYSQLLQYRSGAYDPLIYLEKIEDHSIKSLIKHMIQLDHTQRNMLAWPDYFGSFLHQYIGAITESSVKHIINTSAPNKHIEADNRLDRVFHDLDKICYLFNIRPDTSPKRRRSSTLTSILEPAPRPTRHNSSLFDDGVLIILSLVTSAVRNTTRPSPRVRGCNIISILSERMTDEAKLDRCLPYLMALLGDDVPIVRGTALHTITQMLSSITMLSPINAFVIPEYVLPRMDKFTRDQEPWVRACYASCISRLAETATRFLDVAQALRAEGTLTSGDPESDDGFSVDGAFASFYDLGKHDLQEIFEEHVLIMLTDSDPSVKRALLGSMSSLCVFFGQEKASDVLLSHLITYLNDGDWMLRYAFFQSVSAIGTFVGDRGLEDYIMPLMGQALTDSEETVVEKVIQALASMTEMGLFQKTKLWTIVNSITQLTLHPNFSIRKAAISFLVSAASRSTLADLYCIFYPIIQKWLKSEVADVTELSLFESLQEPLPRPVFDMALSWASKPQESSFWGSGTDPTKKQSPTSLRSYCSVFPSKTDGTGSRDKSEEDAKWWTKLNGLGLLEVDKWKIENTRDYLKRVAARKQTSKSRADSNSGKEPPLDGRTIDFNSLGIQPRTVFFNSIGDRNDIEVENLSAAKTLLALTGGVDIDKPVNRVTSFFSLNNSPRTILKGLSPTSTPPKVPPSIIDSSPYNPGFLPLNKPDVLSSRKQSFGSQRSIRTSSMPLTEERPKGLLSQGSRASSYEGKRQNVHLLTKPSIANLTQPLSVGTIRALPETFTNVENAHGILERLPDKASSFKDSDTGEPPEKQKSMQEFHTYEGNDPNILKLLDNVFVENYPTGMEIFGSRIVPSRRHQPLKKNNDRYPHQSTWQPDGSLIAHIAEHTAAVNRISVSPDHAFFITASDDGSVRVWDTFRLEKSAANKSRLVHKHATGSKVKALCMIEETHCFASASNDGVVNVVKVRVSLGNGLPKYSKLEIIRHHELPEGEHCVYMESYKLEQNMVLVMATNRSRIIALDMVNLSMLWTFQNPLQHGSISCFCMDRKKTWILIGTSRGILDLWDLRFLLRLKSWAIPGHSSIHQIGLQPVRGHGRWVCIAGGTGSGEITVWDIEKTQCREVYRTGGGKDSGKGYEAIHIDDDENEIGRRSTVSPTLSFMTSNEIVDRGIRAIALGKEATNDGISSRNVGAHLITGGTDRKIRFWNMLKIDQSSIISGLGLEEPKPTYNNTQLTTHLTLNKEQIALPAAQSRPGKKRVSKPRSSVISAQQHRLLSQHLDAITDIAIIESPFGMVVSVDRSGVIKVFA